MIAQSSPPVNSGSTVRCDIATPGMPVICLSENNLANRGDFRDHKSTSGWSIGFASEPSVLRTGRSREPMSPRVRCHGLAREMTPREKATGTAHPAALTALPASQPHARCVLEDRRAPDCLQVVERGNFTTHMACDLRQPAREGALTCRAAGAGPRTALRRGSRART